ncbi:hypothetical protein [Alteromonas macleodii]|uniref:Uncharacterized protein n=1 Tax=Alteromonas macleodii TaxID=28108 RepID=A0AB36FLU1_ALTMA|nr:hypothetical protein [Alteromonas macleodii]OES24435.1 hypothetical protein BFV95_4702 [Alteromonas macleodii]OES25492.1 hypothetical protein BFV94_4345 [Alteromonas macleodii]OES25957.1 hypothetical protein BFV93_4247 [Alteromonas macleodii]OES38686.1 hypothetical protein BFV96_4797 [Alteromonas macleodii]
MPMSQKPEVGFSSRLNRLLDELGLPMTGRYAYIAKITGMGHSNSRSMFINDRPPKKQQFVDKLLAHFVQNLSHLKIDTLETSDIVDYLFFDRGKVRDFYVQLGAESMLDVSQVPFHIQSEVSDILKSAGLEQGIDIFKDIDSGQRERMLRKLMLFAHESNALTENGEFVEIATSAVTLSRHGLL